MKSGHEGTKRTKVTKGSSWEPTPRRTEQAATATVDSAISVHRELGPGLLESVYEACLAHELRIRGLQVRRQVAVPVSYKGMDLGSVLRLDLLVDARVVVEVKTVGALDAVHRAQLLSYLKLSGHRLGLLINFNTALVRDGLERLVL